MSEVGACLSPHTPKQLILQSLCTTDVSWYLILDVEIKWWLCVLWSRKEVVFQPLLCLAWNEIKISERTCILELNK